MRIRVYGKEGCDVCKQMRQKMERCIEKWGWKDKVALDYIDLTTVDGMAEGAFYDVFRVPTVIVEQNGETVARYNGGVEDSRELKERLERIMNDTANQGIH